MLRSAVAIVLGTLVVASAGLPHDASFHETMVPVKMGDAGGKTLHVSPIEVTVADWQRCVHDNGCSHMSKLAGSETRKPITGVNWFDVNEYLHWANGRSGGGLRLPTREEWLWLNRSLVKPKPAPLFTDPRLAWAAEYGQEKAPGGPVRRSGSFTTTPDGISDLDGNVWEWTMTCASSGFAVKDASDCPAYVVEGEHEAVIPVFERNPAAGGCATGTPPTYLGLRLVSNN